jgi:WD40 repeat protein
MQDSLRESAGASAVLSPLQDAAAWPLPQECCKLTGHRNDILLLQFSHDGEGIATGSKDGSVRVGL